MLILIEMSDVSGMKPPIAVNHLCSGLLVIQVPYHNNQIDIL